MPARKQPESPQPPWRAVLERFDRVEDRIEETRESLEQRIDDSVRSVRALAEDIRSDNRVTAEALEATRVALEQRIERLDEQTRARDAALELAVRDLRVTVQQNSLDIRDLTARVAALARIEERVAALERRGTRD